MFFGKRLAEDASNSWTLLPVNLATEPRTFISYGHLTFEKHKKTQRETNRKSTFLKNITNNK
jgi:hypothetical protein